MYSNLQAAANYLALTSNGNGMVSMWNDFNSLRELIDMLNW